MTNPKIDPPPPTHEDSSERSATKGGANPSVHELPPDPFDPERFTLSQDFDEMAPVKKVVTSIPIHKPPKQEFVRVRPGDEFQLAVNVIHVDNDDDYYLLDRDLCNELANDIKRIHLFLAVTSRGVPFLWPITLPSPDGTWNRWHRSANSAALRAKKCWVRVVANKDRGGYDVWEAQGELGEPEWPNMDFHEILKVAFADCMILNPDHPVIGRLRGRQ